MEEETPDSFLPTDPPSMFSTSMAPPRPTPAGQEELITTVAPTIKEEHEQTGDLTVFDGDNFVSGNTTNVVKDRAGGAVSKPTEEPEDSSVFEINMIRPDVAILDDSVITNPMFAEGKTEETIVDPWATTVMASDLSDNPTESTESDTTEEVLSPSESLSTLSSNYDYYIDENGHDSSIEDIGNHLQPPEQDFSSRTTHSTVNDITAFSTNAPFVHNTQPGRVVQRATTEPPGTTDLPTQAKDQMRLVVTPAATATPVLLGNDASDKDVSGVQSYDESTTLPEQNRDILTEADMATEIDREFFTAVAQRTTTPGAAVTEEPSNQSVIDMHNTSGKMDGFFSRLVVLKLL